MSLPLQSREHNPGAVTPFTQLPPGQEPGDTGTEKERPALRPAVASVMREFRALAVQRGLPIPGPGQGPYEHRQESEYGRTCRFIGRICTGLGCLVGAGLTVLTVNVGAYALPVAVASAGISYAFTVVAGGALRLAFNAHPSNPDSLLPLRRIATGAATVASVSIGTVMYLRFSEDPAMLAWLSFALLAFEVSLLLAGAALGTMARVSLWSVDLVREYEAVLARLEADERKRKYDDEIHRRDD